MSQIIVGLALPPEYDKEDFVEPISLLNSNLEMVDSSRPK